MDTKYLILPFSIVTSISRSSIHLYTRKTKSKMALLSILKCSGDGNNLKQRTSEQSACVRGKVPKPPLHKLLSVLISCSFLIHWIWNFKELLTSKYLACEHKYFDSPFLYNLTMNILGVLLSFKVICISIFLEKNFVEFS